eukprot:Nitzschia sp. Nitz4//scaffold495_size4786//1166//4435//NITZ4_009233-RA/size4786-processed-gene-0.0-mRNA-1//-1//CDS//3329553072//74//frame0
MKNQLPNCGVTKRDIEIAEDIFGPEVGSMKGKTVRHQPHKVPSHDMTRPNIPMAIYEKYRDITICGDIMYVNNVPIPRTIVVGEVIDYNRHCEFKFGEYVQTHEEHSNDMEARTIGALALRPTGNRQGGYYFYSLSTGKIINRNRATRLPMPQDVIDRVNTMGTKLNGKRGLRFGDQNDNPTVDEEPDDEDENDDIDDSDYSYSTDDDSDTDSDSMGDHTDSDDDDDNGDNNVMNANEEAEEGMRSVNSANNAPVTIDYEVANNERENHNEPNDILDTVPADEEENESKGMGDTETVSNRSGEEESIVDATEGRYVVVLDVPGAFMQTEMPDDEETIVRLTEKMVELLLGIDKEMYDECVCQERGESVMLKDPDEDDWKKLVRMMNYLQGTVDLPLRLCSDGSGNIMWWVDAAYAVHNDMKGHTGGTMSLGGGSVYSTSNKQRMVSRSSTESEVIGVYDVLPQIQWTKRFLEAQGMSIQQDTVLYQDNTSAMLLEKNGRSSSTKRTKHMDVRYFYIKDMVDDGEVKIKHCPTDAMLADYFTKPLQGKPFYKLRDKIMNIAVESQYHSQHISVLRNQEHEAEEGVMTSSDEGDNKMNN